MQILATAVLGDSARRRTRRKARPKGEIPWRDATTAYCRPGRLPRLGCRIGDLKISTAGRCSVCPMLRGLGASAGRCAAPTVKPPPALGWTSNGRGSARVADRAIKGPARGFWGKREGRDQVLLPARTWAARRITCITSANTTDGAAGPERPSARPRRRQRNAARGLIAVEQRPGRLARARLLPVQSDVASA
jgi:hypothetical protein